MQYQWLILQDGSLLLEATGRRTSKGHVCTSTLLWPAGTKPAPSNSVVIDPCFGMSGFEDAVRRLSELVEIVQTWRTVAAILESAQLVIPGHGPPIRVDTNLIEALIEKFPRAMLHHRRCPEVVGILEQRLTKLRA